MRQQTSGHCTGLMCLVRIGFPLLSLCSNAYPMSRGACTAPSSWAGITGSATRRTLSVSMLSLMGRRFRLRRRVGGMLSSLMLSVLLAHSRRIPPQ